MNTRAVETLAISEDELFEMANFHPRTTGLRFVVWFSGDPIARPHRPRGKVRVGDEFYPFSLEAPVEWLAAPAPGITAKAFTELTRPALLAYWNGQSDTSELASRPGRASGESPGVDHLAVFKVSRVLGRDLLLFRAHGADLAYEGLNPSGGGSLWRIPGGLPMSSRIFEPSGSTSNFRNTPPAAFGVILAHN